jgi:hypothetical protein
VAEPGRDNHPDWDQLTSAAPSTADTCLAADLGGDQLLITGGVADDRHEVVLSGSRMHGNDANGRF